MQAESFARPTVFWVETQKTQSFKPFSLFWSFFGHFLLAFHRFKERFQILDAPILGS